MKTPYCVMFMIVNLFILLLYYYKTVLLQLKFVHLDWMKKKATEQCLRAVCSFHFATKLVQVLVLFFIQLSVSSAAHRAVSYPNYSVGVELFANRRRHISSSVYSCKNDIQHMHGWPHCPDCCKTLRQDVNSLKPWMCTCMLTNLCNQ